MRIETYLSAAHQYEYRASVHHNWVMSDYYTVCAVRLREYVATICERPNYMIAHPFAANMLAHYSRSK